MNYLAVAFILLVIAKGYLLIGYILSALVWFIALMILARIYEELRDIYLRLCSS